jgi:glucose-1-phosphate thymidylyltransferase
VKGIILAGGSGTRLAPLTFGTSKQLLPVYDKPMIYYPLSVLMQAGIREILVITTPHDQGRFQDVLGDGSDFGIRINYCAQPEPAGLAQAFTLGREFVGDDSVTLILGDNIYFGQGFSDLLNQAVRKDQSGATIFSYHVNNPKRYGVVELDAERRPISIEEKPVQPKSNYAVTGLYVYDNSVLDIAAAVKPSARGELEITDVNRAYMDQRRLDVVQLGQGIAWLDTGTPQSLLEASEYVRSLQRRQGLLIACLEEIAFERGWIGLEGIERAAVRTAKSEYGAYLTALLKSQDK